MDFDRYDLDPSIYDEMLLPDGTHRAHCGELYETLRELSPEELGIIQERVARTFSTEGITFTVYGDDAADERIIPVDCVPRVVSIADWEHLEKGLTQRLQAINLFLGDVYGEGRILEDGVIPVDVVRGCPRYRLEMRGISPPHGTWVAICGTDIVRTNDGFFVLEDNLCVPSGVSYMIANRKAVKESLRRLYRSSRVRGVEHYGSMLRATLRELAPEGCSDPAVALLTPGVYNSAFYEHMFLARELGADLVEGRDLLVDGGFVYARTTTGLRRIDVIYRRVDDDFLDPLVFRPDSLLGVPGLMEAYRLGKRDARECAGHRGRGRQERLRLRPRHGPLLPGRGAGAPERRDLPLPPPGGARIHARQPREACGEARRGVRRLRDAGGAPRDARGAQRVREGRARGSGRLHRAADASALPLALPSGRPHRAAPRRPPTLRAARPGDADRARRLLPRGAPAGEPRRQLEPGRRRQGSVGAGLVLARSAQGPYWMSRYLERAEHLARLLRLQTETLIDRPLPEIHVGWRRIYDMIRRRPPPGDLVAPESDDYALADAYTLADDLTFERSNPSSVRSCFALGRENARQMRQCISGEMWTSLNLSYLRLQELEIQDALGGVARELLRRDRRRR